MHEMSIALEICNIAERSVGRDRLAHVVTVGLEVGDDAGVEFDNLEFWLETLLSSPPFNRAKAVIDRVAGDALRVNYVEVDDGGAER